MGTYAAGMGAATSPSAVLALVVALATVSACGDETPAASTDPTGTTPVESGTTEPGEATEAPGVDLGEAPVVALTAQQICQALPVAAASVALGTEVAQAEPSADATPQCTYSYGGDSSTLSTFTIAAQRPDDVGGRTLQDAFDYVLDLNRGLAADAADVDEVEVEAGERAVRLTGEALSLVVVATGGHLLTIIATPDLDVAAVDTLAAAAATALA